MAGGSRAFGAALALLLCATSCLACSSVSYSDGKGTVVSARNMDFAGLPPLAVSYVPSGLNDTFVPVWGLLYSKLGKTYTRKFDYACVTPSRKLLYDAAAAAFPAWAKKVDISNWPGICNDGINSAGLGLSLQWQLDTKNVPPYNPLKPGPSVDQADFANYVLANFGSVAELKAAFDAGLTVTWNPLFKPASLLGLKTGFIPCHWGVWDKTGASLVVEFSDKQNVYINDVGVLTNNPLFPKQLQYLQAVSAAAAGPPNNQPPLTPSLHDTTFYPSPGSFNSSDRFARLAMLKSTANLVPWQQAYNFISPGFALPGSTNPSIQAVLSLINSVYLPKGMDDTGGVGPKEADWTIFQTIRDHTRGRYYWRVANTPLWSMVKLNRVDWAALRVRKSVGGVLMLPSPVWALDMSSATNLSKLKGLASVDYNRMYTCLAKCIMIQDAATLYTCVHKCL